MGQDWKDMLAALASEAAPADENNDHMEDRANKEPQTPRQTKPLHVVVEKKGRKGKVATIIEGFEIDDEEVAEIASELKRRIGTGGSSRGGEILLQGDWREKAIQLLKEKGYVAR